MLSRTRRDLGFTVMEVLIVVVVIALIAAIAIPGLITSQRSSHERNASTSLKTICVAQTDFRSNDRDGNRVSDFWTYDIKSLYTMTSASTTGNAGGTVDPPIRLVDLSLAAADAEGTVAPAGGENIPVTSFAVCATKAGYWFSALTLDNSAQGAETTYKVDTGGIPSMGTVHNLTKYAFTAFPDSATFGKYVFIINENNTVYRAATSSPVRLNTTVPPGLTGFSASYQNWPDDLTLKSYWAKLE